MRILNNSPFVVKIALPFLLTLAVGAGLVAYARSVMNGLADRTGGIVEVQAARQAFLARVQYGLTEATLMDRNILLESSPEARGRFRVRKQAAMTEVRESADRLVALSDSPERRAANQGLRQNVDAFFAILDRIGALAASQRGEEAFRVARDEGLPARTKLNEWLQARTAILAGELQDAKALPQRAGVCAAASLASSDSAN